ncbi:MAG TPA: FAD-binding oxidoreductase [Candidatus Udaeobacter sp.]|jgi:FAD/FMN-containing dehydrogenase
MPTRRSFLRTSLAATTAILADVSSIVAKEKPPISNSSPDPHIDGVKFLTPEATDYATARKVYNAGILTQPKVIASCTSETGVQRALERAKAENWPVAVKAGGHSFEGFCLNDNGLVVSVAQLRQMHLDPKTAILTAGPGCRLEEVNQFLLAKGRFLPAGSCGTVGLAGLTLGGGYGMFARKWGLTCDHLVRIKMVDGAGMIRDSEQEPDLLWAARGGGNGHFGIVTELTFKTRAAPSQFSSWKFRTYKLDAKRATALLETWFDASADLPNESFSAWIMNGGQVTVLVTTIGSREQKGLTNFRRRMGEHSKKTTSGGPTSVKRALSWYYGDPGPVYFKNASAGYYKKMEDIAPALPGIFEEVLSVPGLIFQINTLGGAISNDVEGAYPHRAFPYLGESQAYWESPSHAARLQEAAGRMRDHIGQAGITRHYANYPDLAFKDWPTAYYGAENYARLQQLKQRYDPENRIRYPQSVRLPG